MLGPAGRDSIGAMTSLWLLVGAIAALLVLGFGMPLGTAIVVTVVILMALVGRGFFQRRPTKVVIIQDLTTGKAEYQPMDGPTQRYLATRSDSDKD